MLSVEFAHPAVPDDGLQASSTVVYQGFPKDFDSLEKIDVIKCPRNSSQER
jgi:hypothetical protein